MKRKVVLLLLLSLFANGAMSQVGIYRSSNYGAIKKVKKVRHYEWNTMTLLNYEYDFGLGMHSVGATFARCKLGGFYGSVMASTQQWPKADVVGNWWDYFVTNNVANPHFSVTAGGMIRLVIPIYIYLGVGYNYTGYYHQLHDDRWIKIDGSSGLGYEGGVMASIKNFTLQLGYDGSVKFSRGAVLGGIKAGVGYSFGSNNKKQNVEQQDTTEQ